MDWRSALMANPADSAELLKVRSRKADAIETYLLAIMGLANRDAPSFLGGRDPTQLYVMPEVLRAGAHGGSRFSPDDQRPGQFDDREDGEDERVRIRWDREWPHIRRAAVIGVPGEGKTLLTQMTARGIAHQSLRDLHDRRVALDELIVPVWVPLASVAENGLVRAVKSGIRQLVKNRPHDRELIAAHVLSKLVTPRCWLFLDAMDETPHPGRLRAALEPIASAECRIIVTSRPYGYEPRLLPFGIGATYEMSPLRPQERRQFIGAWFANDEERRRRTIELAQSSPQFNDLTRNGLILSLTCAVSERHHLDPAAMRRVNLYDLIIRDMLRGVWKGGRLLAEDNPHVALMFSLLSSFAWALFYNKPQRRIIPDETLVLALSRRLLRHSSGMSVERLLSWWQKVGLLVWAAPGKRLFLHRSFHEYLAARHVARLKNPTQKIERFLWQEREDGLVRWEPAAAEYICFLAGAMLDPNPLLQTLMAEHRQRPDLAQTMLRLAGRCLGDAQDSIVQSDLVDCISNALAEFFLRDQTWAGHSEILPSLRHVHAMNWLLTALREDNDQVVRGNAAAALGSLGDVSAVDGLLSALREDEHAAVRGKSAEALGSLGDARAVDGLLIALREDEAALVRMVATTALERIGDERSLEGLLAALREDKNPNNRWWAAEALGSLGDARGIDGLLTALREDKDPAARRSAAYAMAKLGDARIGEWLLTASREDKDLGVRWSATHALAMLGDARAVDALLAVLPEGKDSLGLVRATARSVLIQLSNRTGQWIPP